MDKVKIKNWYCSHEIELKRDVVYLLRKKQYSFRYEYTTGVYAGELPTKWYGPKPALWVQGENGPQEPEKYEFCELELELTPQSK